MKKVKFKWLFIALAMLAVQRASAFDFDLNGDGKLDMLDYEVLSGIIVDKNLSYDAKYDVDGNGTIDAVDANLLVREASRVRTFTVNGVSFRMIMVEKGTFSMGATADQGADANAYSKPVHKVTLTKNFFMLETEVTQALWKAVMGEEENPSSFAGNDNLPVENVSWNNCQSFIQALNNIVNEQIDNPDLAVHFRLPTEAEWEYAARGGKYSASYRYSGSNTVGDVAWCGYETGYMTHAVAQKQKNELGLYDMSGNVWEWCNDWFGSYKSSDQTDPQGATSGSGKIIRGGAWSGEEDYCRVSYRSLYSPGSRSSDIGFRLALDE